jgi:hypothetical protein
MKKCILFYVSLVLVLALITGSAQGVLVHKWNFNITGANPTGLNDVIGGVVGTPVGAPTVGGGQLSTLAAGDYLDIAGPTIDINDYSAVTLVMWSTQYFDEGYSMTAALGSTNNASWGYGMQYLALSTTRGDQVTRAMMTTGEVRPGYEVEVGENGPELNDGVEHMYALSVGPLDCCFNQDVITLYIDGVLQGAHIIDGRSLSTLSSDFAYLAKSLYNGDATWIGDINEFRIYDEALSCEVIGTLIPDPTPEPATLVLLGLGSLALLRRRKS